MKVSIIVPVYNSKKYLRSCLDSLVNQTLSDIEIIAIDDASTDNSLAILKEYQKKYPNLIKIIRNEKNMGQSIARNKGIKIAKGDYIGFLDSDDYVNYNMYKTMYEGAVKNNYPEVIITGLNFVKDDYYLKKNFIGLARKEGRIIDVLKDPNFILMQSPSVCNKLFRKDTIKDKLFLEGRMWEDVAFSFAKMFNANRILSFNNLDYFYRKRDNEGVSSIGFNINPHLLDIIDVADSIEKETINTNRYDIFKKQIKFIQCATCLQRAEEIMKWQIPENDKNNLCKLISIIVIQKYGNWMNIPIEYLSTRIGFLELEKLKELTNECNLIQIKNPKEQLTNKLSDIKKML